jgi:MFS family permease
MKKRPIGWIIPALILILIASILFPIWDFGWFYSYDSYYGIRTTEWLYFNHIISGPFMVCAMFLFVATFVLMLITLISKKVGRKKAPYIIGIVAISMIFLMSLIGAIAVAIVGESGDYTNWDWDGACFVGNIAPLLILPFLMIALIRVSIWKKKQKDED